MTISLSESAPPAERIARLTERLGDGYGKLRQLEVARDPRFPRLFGKWLALLSEYEQLVLRHGEDR
jgi:hypothetical protein